MIGSTALLALLPLAAAQYGGSGGSSPSSSSAAASTPSSTSSSSSAVHTVAVGKGGLTFSPNNVAAAVGDQVVFEFFSGPHSVHEGPFSSPCQDTNGNFSSGVITGSGKPSDAFTITVNSTTPIWYFCGAPGHCQAGMVGSINAPSSGNTIDAYTAASKKTTSTNAQLPVMGGTVGTPPSPSSSSGSSSGPSTSSSSAAPSPSTGAANDILGATRGNAMLSLAAAVFAFLY